MQFENHKKTCKELRVPSQRLEGKMRNCRTRIEQANSKMEKYGMFINQLTSKIDEESDLVDIAARKSYEVAFEEKKAEHKNLKGKLKLLEEEKRREEEELEQKVVVASRDYLKELQSLEKEMLDQRRKVEECIVEIEGTAL